MNGYVDFHSGILPKLDAEDMGAEVDRCVDILKILHKAKIKTVVATPFFNSVDNNVPSFLANREESYKLLSDKIKGMSLPRIIFLQLHFLILVMLQNSASEIQIT